MPRPTKDPPTEVLSAAAKLLRVLTPSTVGMMSIIANNPGIQSQDEIAEAVGRSQSSISDYQKELEGATPPLAMRRGQSFALTDTGEELIDLISSITASLGCDLSSVDWTDEADKDTVDTHLTPLHDSRSILPLCILDSLSERSDIDGHNDTASAVWIDDLMHDLEIRQADSDELENLTMNQIRRMIRLRFVDTELARFEDSKITLLEKGILHAWLLDGLTHFLKQQTEIEAATTDTKKSSSPPTTEQSANSDERPHRDVTSNSDEQQEVSQLSRVDEQQLSIRAGDEDQPRFVPVYWLRSSESEGGDPELILPSTIAAEDLVNRAQQLAYEHGPDAEFRVDLMIQDGTDIYPITSETNAPPSPDALIQSDDRSE
jgi:DNA-binding MarR family transcriptional regulator